MIKGEKRDYQSVPLDEQPSREKMDIRIIRGHEDNRHKGESLPIKKWFRSKVGQNWDTVYSDFKVWIKKNKPAERFHIDPKWYVNLNCYRENGLLFDSEGYALTSFRGWRELYVDPDDNILKFAPQRPTFNRPKQIDTVWKDKTGLIQYKKYDGIWYELTLKEVDQNEIVRDRVFDWHAKTYKFVDSKRTRWKDVVKGDSMDIQDMMREYGVPAVCIKKEQLSKNDLKKAGLR